ncbi:hypothetical protein MNV49_007559 [Pseudohyphozyma bogoriensis]|nr:hypothetical protein MNV49_007559 [Pseudohyphozyma bogoriensis]
MILPSASDEGHGQAVDPTSSAVHQTKQGDLPFPLPPPPPAYSPRHPSAEVPPPTDAFEDPATRPPSLSSVYKGHPVSPIFIPWWLPRVRTGLYVATCVWSMLVITLAGIYEFDTAEVPALLVASILSILGAATIPSDSYRYVIVSPLIVFSYIQWSTLSFLLALLLVTTGIERVNGRKINKKLWKARWEIVTTRKAGSEVMEEWDRLRHPLMREVSRHSRID